MEIPEEYQQDNAQSISVSAENKTDQPVFIRIFDAEYNNDGIKIESETPGISYSEMLRWLAGHRVIIGKMIFYFGEYIEDFDQEIAIVTKDIFGTQVHIPLKLEVVQVGDTSKKRTFEIRRTQVVIDGLSFIFVQVPANRKLFVELLQYHEPKK